MFFIFCTLLINCTLFTMTITSVAVYLNWDNSLMGERATYYNLVVTIAYLLFWIVFSFCWGLIKDFKYQKFILIYWGIHLACFILLSISPGLASLIAPLVIWFGSSTYGFRYFHDSPYTVIYNLACGLIPLILNILGYWGGVATFERLKCKK